MMITMKRKAFNLYDVGLSDSLINEILDLNQESPSTRLKNIPGIISKLAEFKNDKLREILEVIFHSNDVKSEIKSEIISHFLIFEDVSIHLFAIESLVRLNASEKINFKSTLYEKYEITRAAIIWGKAKTKPDVFLTQKCIDELRESTLDKSRIYLAAALFLVNSNLDSREMKALEQFYNLHYYDASKNELKIGGEFANSTRFIGHLLNLAGLQIPNIKTINTSEDNWLIE